QAREALAAAEQRRQREVDRQGLKVEEVAKLTNELRAAKERSRHTQLAQLALQLFLRNSAISTKAFDLVPRMAAALRPSDEPKLSDKVADLQTRLATAQGEVIALQKLLSGWQVELRGEDQLYEHQERPPAANDPVVQYFRDLATSGNRRPRK